ncbi:unnamed protein product [Paramecium primaurelia]|uniref:Uncharacterized protein n=1 Tax=Paramecium primaurelia TaxID=5886 RepID=A0A8S1K4I9_PARPR|nr:unnamed protein product [Paramecium primaurelia]
MNNLLYLYIIGGTLVGVTCLYLLKQYINGGICKIRKDMTGKVILITGGNAGIGAEAAKKLGEMGADIIIGCRDLYKAQQILDQIKSQSRANQKLVMLKLDLTDLRDIDTFVQQFKALNIQHIDILINNAGIMAPKEYKISKQGFELQFGTNHIGHFYLTQKLLPFLRNSQNPRLVNVSSMAHKSSDGFDLNDLDCKRFSNSSLWSTRYTMKAYSYSKLCNILHAMEFSKKYGIPAYSLHPGVVRTELFNEIYGGWRKIIYFLIYPFWWFFTKSPEQGAQTTLYLSLEDQENLQPGGYYKDCSQATPLFANEQLATQLWDKSIQMLREKQFDISQQ